MLTRPLRTVAALALLAYAPLALAAPRVLGTPARFGDSGRVKEAPDTLGPEPEALEVAHGLVWLVGPDGQAARHATRVPAGLYLTSAGMAKLDASVKRELATYRARVAALEDEVARLQSAPAQAILVELGPEVEVPAPLEGHQPAQPSHERQGASLGPWPVVALVLVVGFALGRASR